MTKFEIVVATDANFGIGRHGDLPWHLPRDMRFFKEVTTGVHEDGLQNAVIMGRKTWASIPERFRPLSNRLNIILTRQKDWTTNEDALVAHSLDQALELVENASGIADVFVVGGGEIYKQAIDDARCTKLHITRIESSFDCDTHFPDPSAHYTEVDQGEILEEKGIPFRFTRWERRSY